MIPGWELAVKSMKPNEVAEVVCRSEYAFGDSAGYEDKIPPGSTIVTRLQLLDWRSLKGAGSTDVEGKETRLRVGLDWVVGWVFVWVVGRTALTA